MPMSDFGHALAIFALTFVLEDIAVLGAALLVVNSMVSLPWAAGASFAGIWLGDLGLYLIAYRLGRPVLDNKWFLKFVGKVDLRKSEAWFQNHGTLAILISRLIPGTRLPTYLAAGLLRVPYPRFTAVTGLACLVWVGCLFWLSYNIGMMALSTFEMFKSEIGKLLACTVLAIAIAWPLRKLFRKCSMAAWVARWKRLRHWEFWPAWFFYIPIAFKYVGLAIRHGSVTLPALSNPGMPLGGLIGESKQEPLAALEAAYPEFTAKTFPLVYGSVESQLARVQEIVAKQSISLPFVLKPDVGQRGDGFKLVRSMEDAAAYLAGMRRAVLLQEYLPGPEEAGIFYYRLPGEPAGRIFAITRKQFPVMTGDGVRTLEELIHADRRASIIAHVYLARFGERARSTPNAGERVRLVEAGNHCQGAIFLEGGDLKTPELERRIDIISKRVPGFFVGRYDVRYSSDEELRRGEGFKILELNGASSEATNVYDPRNSVWDAYRILFRQWEILFEAGARNRAAGSKPASASAIVKEWMNYRRVAAKLPASD